MENELDLSIIVPVYNCEQFLIRCLDSIRFQNYSSYEVIVINDGSTDRSLEICNEYKNKDKRFRVFSIENHGAAYARNYGLARVRGKYVGFVDADDYIDPAMYSRLMEAAKQNDADIVSCDIVHVLPDGRETQITNSLEGGVYDRADIISKLFPILLCSPRLEIETPFTMVLKVFRKVFLDRNKIEFDNALLAGQDFVFSTTALFYAKRFVYLKEAYCYYYFQNKTSRTHRYLPNAWTIYSNTNRYWIALTSECKEYDFSDQLKLDKFHGLLMSLNYLFKPGNKSRRHEKISEAIDLMKKETDQTVFSLLDYKTMRIKQKIACFLIKHKLYKAFAYSLLLYYK